MMDSNINLVRDSYYTGRYGYGIKALQAFMGQTEWEDIDSISRRYVSIWEFLLKEGTKPTVNEPEDQEQTALWHIIRVLSPISEESSRLESWHWLKKYSNPTKNSLLSAFILFTLSVTSLDGRLPANSTELGDINDYMTKLSQYQLLDADFLHLILCATADRWDLALEVANQLSGTLEESMTVHLAHVWKAMIRGQWSEAYLCLEDIETLLNLPKGEETPCYLQSLKALARLHEGDSEETVLLGSQANDASGLINVIAAHHRLGNLEEAEKVTQKLTTILPSSHPYLQPLQELDELALIY